MYVLVVGQQAHAAVPKAPKDLDDSVAASVMPHRGGKNRFRHVEEFFDQVGHEFWGLVAVKDGWWTIAENNVVQEKRHERFRLSILQGDDRHIPRSGVDDRQRFVVSGS
jgi:hypothetical protein